MKRQKGRSKSDKKKKHREKDKDRDKQRKKDDRVAIYLQCDVTYQDQEDTFPLFPP